MYREIFLKQGVSPPSIIIFRNYQGNNRVVVAPDGTVEQQNDYYAYGGPWGDTSTNQGLQPFKYNGKELDRIHGLDWYDYGARRYDPAFAQFTQMDPLSEKYPHLSPYAYCAGNPVNYVDPDGKHIRVRKKKDGLYDIEGGNIDGDLNVYDITDGWENRVSIGKSLTQYSFFDDNGKPSIGSKINLNDLSGQEFVDNFMKDAPFITNYMVNATGKKKYDFKQKDAQLYPETSTTQYNNRGMNITIDGQKYIASARDIGNYVAGFVVGSHGVTWPAARIGFDFLETKQHNWCPTIEGKPSQFAQYKGYKQGLKHISWSNALKVKLIEFVVLKSLLP